MREALIVLERRFAFVTISKQIFGNFRIPMRLWIPNMAMIPNKIHASVGVLGTPQMLMIIKIPKHNDICGILGLSKIPRIPNIVKIQNLIPLKF